MKQKKRFNPPRYNNRNTQRQITRNTVLESSGPCGKLRGTALQLCEKYQQAYKDAMMQNDLVLAQSCLQYADHYTRLQNQAIQNEQQYRQNNQPYRFYQPREDENTDELPRVSSPEGKEAVLTEPAETKETVTDNEPTGQAIEQTAETSTDDAPAKKTLRLKKKPTEKKVVTHKKKADTLSLNPAEFIENKELNKTEE